MKKIRPLVFWPPFVLLIGGLALSVWDAARFGKTMTVANDWVLTHFSSAFATGGLLMLTACVVVFFSPLGKVTLGGTGAKRLLSPVSWTTVALCTNTGVGILFWAMAEPMYHLSQPPASMGLAANSEDAARFALSTLFLHWSFTPSAIFALPGLMFAIAFYNMKLPFSLSSSLFPLLGRHSFGRMSSGIDAVSLYALVAGMAASLATGVLTLSGGMQHVYGIKSAPGLWILVGVVIVAAFMLSALTGLEKGIKWLSNLNTGFFAFLAILVLSTGPMVAVAQLSWGAMGDFVSQFVDRSLFLSFKTGDPWPKNWTVFYMAVWFAWAPVTAAFLGRIGVGYTVRRFIIVNLFVPSLFAIFWMTIFGGTTLQFELSHVANLVDTLTKQGPEALAYTVLAKFPFAPVVIPVFLFTVFISYVTAADSSTIVMAGMSSTGISPESPEAGIFMKLIWGCLVGGIALVMLCQNGIDGIKTLSYLGGVPALIYQLAVMVCLLMVAFRPKAYLKMM